MAAVLGYLNTHNMQETDAMNMKDAEKWYKDHGPVSEMPGERSWIGRLYDFETFKYYGQAVADFLRDYDERFPEDKMADDYPELAELVMGVFPDKKGR